jgi:hypothetical protein
VRRTCIEIRIAFSIRTVTTKNQGEGLAHFLQRYYLQAFKKYGVGDEIKV